MTKLLKINFLCLLFLALMALTFSQPVWAHGVVWRQAPSDKTITLSFLYSDQTPMKYSKVLLHSPQDPEVPYQSGVTDLNGGFAFIPNVPGLWKFAANDGQGHLSSGELEVVFPEVTDLAAPEARAAQSSPASQSPSPAPSPALASGGSQSPTKETIALGLSLIVNIALVARLLWKKPKAKALS
ncbi:MAG: hypothetical protein LBE80_04920 [Deltaproteobacteria bacterium]|jgi:nickel transport protein|nr:hypothetical protein [Deltaproteobacteria bacterium]